MALQKLFGYIADPDGSPSKNLLIEATSQYGLQSVSGVNVDNIKTRDITDTNGYFELYLIDGITCTIEGKYTDESLFFSEEITVTNESIKNIIDYLD